MDGFDVYQSESDLQFQYAGFNCGISTNLGRYNNGALYINSYNNYLIYVMPNQQSEIWTGFALSVQGLTGSQPIIGFQSSSGIESSIWYAPNTSTWTAYNGINNTLLGTSIKSVGLSAYHWIEFHYKISTSVGIVEIWIDNIQIMNLTAINTTYYSNSTFSNIIIGGNGSNSVIGYYDDLYILNTNGTYNNTRLGDSRIETLLPNSDASPNTGIPSVIGSHYAMVDSAQNNGGSTYVTLSNTSNQEELYKVNSLVSTPASVYGVKVLNLAEKSSVTNTISATESIIVSNGVISTGNVTNLTSQYSTVVGIFETDPNTGNVWTYGNVNIANVGIKVP
jgi:hypothetical protein